MSEEKLILPDEKLLRTAHFQEVFNMAKFLKRKNYDVRMTSSDGYIVHLDRNGLPVINHNGQTEEYRFTLADIYGNTPWGIQFRRNGDNKGAWMGLVEARKRFGLDWKEDSNG